MKTIRVRRADRETREVIVSKSFHRSLAFAVAASLVAACGGGGGGGSTPPRVTVTPSGAATSTATSTPNPTPTSTTVDEAAFQCPTSDTVATSAARSARGLVRRSFGVGGAHALARIPGRLAVTYDLATLRASRATFAARESASNARLVHEFDFAHLGTAIRVLAVSPANVAAVAAALRTQPGVRSVALAGARRAAQTVNGPYFTNDPYFTGFANPVPPSTGATTPPSTYEVGPYEENPGVPGQWNMHAIHLDDAFAYSQGNNGSGVAPNANALGSSGVKIAIIDVGEDTTHPELQSKITYQKCFITDPSGNQSTSDFTTDELGHGTDVSGIAAAATNNDLGFAGAGGNTSIYGYRVQATPDDNCTSDTTQDDQCLVDSDDIASAIEDAVAQHVNVISISLGGGTCSNGQDDSPTEGQAVADALAANIVVVASSGNAPNSSGPFTVESPACDTGVIAAGASALADGQTNGTGSATGSSSSPNEYVASYSDYGTPGAAVHSSSAWGIVAPGGDPSSDTDQDDLHWITDIWTTTPFDSNFAGACFDYPSSATTDDCQTLIAGTSMAAPTVAGAAALIIAVNGGYQSPSKMKQLLCSTADDIADAKEGCGRMNVYRAMATAIGDPNLP